MTVPGLLTTTAEGWFRLDMPDGLGKHLRRLCRMAYGVHLHAPVRGCHVTVAPPGRRPESAAILHQSFEVEVPLGEWWHNTNAVWTPIGCPSPGGLFRLRKQPHLCIGYLTQEATNHGDHQ